jgi:hypothetical protein
MKEEKAVDMLVSFVKNPELRDCAITGLLSYTKNIKAFRVLEEIIKTDKDELIIDTACWQLAKLGNQGFGDPLPVLQDLLKSTHNIKIQISVFRALGCYAGKGRDVLYDYYSMETENEKMKKAILIALCGSYFMVPGDKRILPLLIKTLDNPSQEIREIAYSGLVFLSDDEKLVEIIPSGMFRAFPDIPQTDVKEELEKNWDKYCSKMKNYYEINKDYFVPEFYFIVDEKAKAAGIPTDEYRKTHPWPKEENKDTK